MLPDRVSNPGPLTNESGALPIALRGPACKALRNMLYFACVFIFGMTKLRHYFEIREKENKQLN